MTALKSTYSDIQKVCWSRFLKQQIRFIYIWRNALKIFSRRLSDIKLLDLIDCRCNTEFRSSKKLHMFLFILKKYLEPVLVGPCHRGMARPQVADRGTAWRVLRLRIEERPPIRRVAANKLNKQSRTADEGWSSSLGVGRGANNPSLLKPMFSNPHRRDDSSGPCTPHPILCG